MADFRVVSHRVEHILGKVNGFLVALTTPVLVAIVLKVRVANVVIQYPDDVSIEDRYFLDGIQSEYPQPNWQDDFVELRLELFCKLKKLILVLASFFF